MGNDIIRFLESLGIAWKYVINGFIGGFIWSLYRKSKFFEAVRQMLVGAIVSGYFTPLIVSEINAEDHLNLIASTSFIIGMMGMVIVDSTYKFIVNKIRKWKEVMEILANKKTKSTNGQN